MRHLFFLATCLSLSAIASQGLAYQQTLTCTQSGQFACKDGETPQGVHWSKLTVKYNIQRGGSPDFERKPDGSINQELYLAIRDSFKTWNDVSCSDITFVEAGLVDRSELGLKCSDEGTNESINLIMWPEEWAYSNGIYALTSVTFNSKNGVIFDADIEFNERFNYTNTDSQQDTIVDVKNTLTHEIGHFLGLDHEDSIPEATMYSMAPEGELEKRDLHPDDIDGICAIYPTGQPATNEPPVNLCGNDNPGGGICGDGCITAPTAPPTPWVGLILIGLIGLRRRP